jgi:hypothetical protein
MSLVTRGRSAGCVAAGRSSVGEPTVHVSRKQADASAGPAETGQQNRMVVGAAGRYRGPAQRECAVPATTASSRRSHNEVDGPAGLRSPESGTGRATKDRLRLARVRSGRLRRRMPGSPLAGNEACSQICAVMTPHLAHLWLSGTTEVLGSGLAISRATKARERNHPNQQLRPGHLTTTSLGEVPRTAWPRPFCVTLSSRAWPARPARGPARARIRAGATPGCRPRQESGLEAEVARLKTSRRRSQD